MIIVNQIRTPDGTILRSHSTHDYQTYKDKNGEIYMVDGGTDYLRRNVNKHPYAELSVYSTDSFAKIRESLYWGTYGINGDRPLSWVSLSEMKSDHIQAVLDTQRIPEWRRDYCLQELSLREENIEEI